MAILQEKRRVVEVKNLLRFVLAVVLAVLATVVVASAQEPVQAQGQEWWLKAAKAVAGGLAFLGGALGTGHAQSKIGAALIGAIAENEKNLGPGLIVLTIPETLVILGFVLVFLM